VNVIAAVTENPFFTVDEADFGFSGNYAFQTRPDVVVKAMLVFRPTSFKTATLWPSLN
jgi:hypothetical protein